MAFALVDACRQLDETPHVSHSLLAFPRPQDEKGPGPPAADAPRGGD